MITHNIETALEYGNKTIMMNRGRIVYTAEGEERRGLTVPTLMEKFKEASGDNLNTDRILLS